MIVSIEDYGFSENKGFVTYKVSGLTNKQFDFLENNLEGEIKRFENFLILKLEFNKKLYPFSSDDSKIRFDDFKAREEIEMNIFLSGFLEDLYD